jgi:formylglycine-generating enzyme required for sulfatase activity
MAGNISEWVYDWFGDYSIQAVRDPVGAAISTARVVRGGSWKGYAFSMRAARRVGDPPTYRGDYHGFRLIRY